MGDLSAKVGNEEIYNVTEKFGLEKQNERGEQWISWCKANDQCITNTRFMNLARLRWSCRDPEDRKLNQIDYITINHRFRNAVIIAKTYPGADGDSDHNPVICSIKLELHRLKRARQIQNFSGTYFERMKR